VRGVGARVALATVVALALAAASPAGLAARDQDPSEVCTPDPGWGTLRPELVPRVLALLNAHRTAEGLPALASSAELTASAVWKARHMAAFGYLDPSDPAPPIRREFGARFLACGYSGPVAAENVAEGFPDADSIVAASLQDPVLRANVDNQAFTVVGIAAASDAAGVLYWVEDFGSAPPPPAQARCRVPRLIGKTLTAAVQTIRHAGCSIGRVRLVPSRLRRGLVLSQSPRPGTLRALGGRVNLAVSIGRR